LDWLACTAVDKQARIALLYAGQPHSAHGRLTIFYLLNVPLMKKIATGTQLGRGMQKCNNECMQGKDDERTMMLICRDAYMYQEKEGEWADSELYRLYVDRGGVPRLLGGD